MRQQIPKAAMRASNNAIRGYIPHNAIVSQGARIAARQQAQEKPQRYEVVQLIERERNLTEKVKKMQDW